MVDGRTVQKLAQLSRFGGGNQGPGYAFLPPKEDLLEKVCDEANVAFLCYLRCSHALLWLKSENLVFAALSAVMWCYNNPFCVPTSMKWTFVNLEHTLLCSIIQRSTCPPWKSTSWSCRKWEKNSASMRVIVGHLKCKVSSIICWLFVSLVWSFSHLWRRVWGEM